MPTQEREGFHEPPPPPPAPTHITRDVKQNLSHVLVVAIARCQRAKILPVRAQFNLFGYVISYSNDKYFQRVNSKAIYAYFGNESTRRLVEDLMTTGLTNTYTARGLSVLYHVFARKQCILCSPLRHKNYLRVPYVTSLRDSFCS